MRGRLVIVSSTFWAVYTLLMLLIPRSVNAAEWSALPSIRAGREYNSNLRLTVLPHDSVTGSLIAPKLDLAATADKWQLTGGAEAVQKRFSGDSDLNRDDRFYNLAASFKTERSTWQLAGSSTKSSVLTDERISPDTGLVEVQKVQDLHNINPVWIWSVNEITQLQLSYSLSNVSYVDGQIVGLNDYVSRIASAQLSTRIDSNDQVFFSAGYSTFNVPSTTFESKSNTYQLGITRTFSETMSATLSGGQRYASSKQTVLCPFPNPFYPLGPLCFQPLQESIVSHTSSSVFNGILDKKYETTRIKLAISRSIDPSGLGGEVRTDSQVLTLSRQLTARLIGNFSYSNYGYKSQTANLAGIERHYYALESGLQWSWTRELSADLRYRYGHIKRADEDKPATANSAYLTLRYEWPKMSFSR